MSQTAYIDELLKAETEATEIIQNAQKQRQRKLKQAREVAELQVANYRRQKQEQFEKLKAQKTDKKFEADLQRQTKQEIAKIQQDYNKNKDKVIDMLVQKVLQVDLSVPNSVRQKFLKKK